MTEQELARLLHIDEDDDLSIANAVMYQGAAEEYLAGAGVKKDYDSSLYKQAIIVLVTRSLDRPDMLTKFSDMPVGDCGHDSPAPPPSERGTC